jgi:hypothetical protein
VLSASGAGYTINGGDDLVRMTGDNWSLSGTEVGNLSATRGTGRGVDLGGDDETGIRWGRWESGRVNLRSDSVEAENISLGDGGMHWIASDDLNSHVALPSTGSVSFELYGSTSPTSNTGEVGVLGSAELTAHFDTSTVDASLGLTMPGAESGATEQWAASATGLELNAASASFDGAFDTVTVTTESGVTEGEGWLSGFFTGDSTGEINGAGLGYSLSDGDDRTVSGTAAFRVAEQDPPPVP